MPRTKLYCYYGTSLREDENCNIYHTKLHFEDHRSLYSQSTLTNQNPSESTGILNYPFRRKKLLPPRDKAPKFLACPNLISWRRWALIIIFKTSPIQLFGFFLAFDTVRDLLVLLGDRSCHSIRSSPSAK